MVGARIRGALLPLLGLAWGCSLGEVPLEGKACPCAAEWTCDPVEMVCVRRLPLRDAAADSAGPPSDGGTPIEDGDVPQDAGTDARAADAGETDAGTLRSFAVQVMTSADDAEECMGAVGSMGGGLGNMYVGSTDLELGEDNGVFCFGEQLVGMRFDDVSLPPDAAIVEAYLDLVVDEPTTRTTSLELSVQAADDPAAFSLTDYDLSTRPRGSARVSWPDVPPWETAGDRIRSPDLSPLLREVVERPGWAPGNAIVVFVEGSGERVTTAYDSDPASAPTLRVTYVE